MNSFKDIACQILKEAGKPLHGKEITKIALGRGWLKTAGKTPESTTMLIIFQKHRRSGASRCA